MPSGVYKRSEKQIAFLREITKRPRNTRVLADILCPNCNKSFRPSSSLSRYCSKKCFNSKRPRKGVNKICVVCGKKYYVKQSSKDAKYCSRDCQHKGLLKGKIKKCDFCGKEFYKSPSHIKNNKKSFCSRNCMAKHFSINYRGKNGPGWKGGKLKAYRILRNGSEYKKWRTSVFERDDYTCQRCGSRNGNGKAIFLHPHHIKSFTYYPESRFITSNGETYCKECHYEVHRELREKLKYEKEQNQNFTN